MAEQIKTTLFELVGDYLRLYEMADDPDIDPQAFADTLEGIEGAIEAKADGCACLIVKLNGDAKTIKEQEDRLYNRRKAIENSIKRIKENLQYAMELTGKTKFKTPLFSYGIQNNPASLVLDTDDMDAVPSVYVKTIREFDKSAIKDAIKNGEDMSGIAHLEQTRGLRIR